jgi:hypothetical protein
MHDAPRRIEMMGRKTLMAASTIAWALMAACGGDDGPTDPGNGPVPELPPVPSSQIILQDDMDNENGGNAETNYTGFALWNVVRLCVDLHGPGSIDPLPGNGLYIDMDGSCDTAGRMESKETFTLEPGTYKFELVIAGNNQDGPTDNMTISVGTVFSQAISMAENEPFQIRDYSFTVSAASTGKIVLDHAGGDKQGILIDVIRLRKTN